MGLPYDMGIDMWSFGCILSELYTGYPIFPGENEAEQMACIMEVLGLPPTSMLDAASRKKTFFGENNVPKIQPNSRGKLRRPSTKDLASVTKCPDQGFLTFLGACLKWVPSERLTPDRALEHPWICEGTAPTPRPSGVSPSNPSASSAGDRRSRRVAPDSGAPSSAAITSIGVDSASESSSKRNSGSNHIALNPASSHREQRGAGGL